MSKAAVWLLLKKPFRAVPTTWMVFFFGAKERSLWDSALKRRVSSDRRTPGRRFGAARPGLVEAFPRGGEAGTSFRGGGAARTEAADRGAGEEAERGAGEEAARGAGEEAARGAGEEAARGGEASRVAAVGLGLRGRVPGMACLPAA
jgi:hypothetical protein